MKERNIQNLIRLNCSKDAVRLFVNDQGVAKLPDGTTIKYGLGNDSPDLWGWKSVVITPDMVGMTLAVTVGIEVKSEKGIVRKGQQTFMDFMRAAGAIVGVARSVEDAKKILA